MKKYIFLLLLSGCTPIFFTDPNLVSVPKDKVKYEADLKDCREEQRMTTTEVVTTALLPGMIPISGVMIGEGKGDDIFKSKDTIRDECLGRKGYEIKK